MRSLGLKTTCKFLNFQLLLSPVIRKNHISSQRQGCYILLTANKSHNWNQIQPHKMWKRNKLQLYLLCCGGKGNFRYNFKFQIFYSDVLMAHSKYTVAPLSSVILLWPSRNLLWSPGVHKVHFETHYTIASQFFLSEARPIQSTPPLYFLKINFNIILSSMPRSSKCPLSLRCSHFV